MRFDESMPTKQNEALAALRVLVLIDPPEAADALRGAIQSRLHEPARAPG
jgi:hypothetical protein